MNINEIMEEELKRFSRLGN